MSAPLVLACLWVLAATATAALPFRAQFLPGLALLAAAPAVLGWIATRHGGVVAALCALAVLSMFRKPLWALLRRAAFRKEENG